MTESPIMNYLVGGDQSEIALLKAQLKHMGGALAREIELNASLSERMVNLEYEYQGARLASIRDEERADGLMIENERLRSALQECAASFATPPGTVSQCQQAVAVEFQRRMDIAGNALATCSGSSPVSKGEA